MEVRLASLVEGAAAAEGTVVVIDVFRAFTTAAIAFARGASRIVMTAGLDEARALRRAGVGRLCIGERGSRKPPGFDFGNSPAELMRADLAGESLILTTSNGTAGILAARRAERIYAGAFVTAAATATAIRRREPAIVTLVAIGRHPTVRADEDELCALYLRSLLEGRQPDIAALRTLLATLPPPIDPALIACGDYDPMDREIAARIDSVPLAIAVERAGGLVIAEPELVEAD